MTSTSGVDVRATPLSEPDDPSVSSSSMDTQRRQQGRDLGEGLSDWADEVAGARVLDLGGPGGSRQLTVRGGAPSQGLVIVDGVLSRSPFATGEELSGFDPEMLANAELLKGGQGTLLGDGALTGALLLRTGGGQPRGSISVGSQSGLRIVAAGGTKDSWVSARYGRNSGRFTYTSSDLGLPDAVRVRNNNASESGRFDFGVRFERGVWNNVARLGLAARDAGTPGFAGSPAENLEAKESRLGLQLSLQSSRPVAVADAATLRLTASAAAMRLGLTNPRLQSRFQTDFVSSRVGGGLDVSWGRHLIQSRLASEFEAVDGDGLARRGRVRLSAAILDEISLASFTLIAGLRVSGLTDRGVWVLPRAALSWAALPSLVVKLGVGRSLRTPTLDELYHPPEPGFVGNSTLLAETAWEASLGADLELGFLDASLVVFGRELDDGILYLNRNAFAVRPENVGDARAVGSELELNLRGTLGPLLAQLRASGNLLASRVTVTKARLPTQPAWGFFVGGRLGPHWLSVGSSLRGFGSTQVNLQPAEGNSVPAYLRWDANLVLRPWPFMSLGLSVTNLLDTRTLQSVNRFPLPGRSALLTLRVEQPQPEPR